MQPVLSRSFYRRDPVAVARALLGQTLVHHVNKSRLAGVIVETEAYLGVIDKAAHTWNGRHTQRNHSMYLDAGHAYVYFTYGMHYCINAVVGQIDEPVAVLIRALEPVDGLDQMRHHRPKARHDSDLCSGPAKLTQALAIDRAHDATDLVTSQTLFIEQTRSRPLPDAKIGVSARIGIASAQEWVDKPLRFFVKGNPNVSR